MPVLMIAITVMTGNNLYRFFEEKKDPFFVSSISSKTKTRQSLREHITFFHMPVAVTLTAANRGPRFDALLRQVIVS